jgi:hypothetical protein
MNAWVYVNDGIVQTVMVSMDRPAGEYQWIMYPHPCDLSGPGSVAGTAIADYDNAGNLKT